MMSELVHTYSFLVKEQHLDTFGHVNNATYLTLFEEARWDWITRNGYGIKKIQETGLGPVILDIKIAFKRELKLRQTVKVETYMIENKLKISRVRQVMLDENGKLCCEAEFSFALFDTVNRKIAEPTEDWLKAIKALPA